MLIQELLNLKFHFPYPVGFIPMYLSSMHGAHFSGEQLLFPSVFVNDQCRSVPKPSNIANRCSNGDWLDTLELSDDLEVHEFPYATKPNARLTLRLRSEGVRAQASRPDVFFKPKVRPHFS